MHLWEAKHPYHMVEGNYFSNDCHTEWESLGDFLGGYSGADIDYNLVIRFDWREGEDWGVPVGESRLLVQMLHQRKAKLVSHEIKITRDEEPAARAYLVRHAERVWENWAPLMAEVGASDNLKGAAQ